ncbi:hypothetical protein HQ535_03690 [bacterium]|nr:hypothetical protein [bacterium]
MEVDHDSMKSQRRLVISLALVLAAPACTGGASSNDPFVTSTSVISTTVPPTTSVSSTTTTTTTPPEISGEVGPEGLLLEFEAGGNLEVPAAALPLGTSVRVVPLDSSELQAPSGTSLVGEAVRISATSQPVEPVIVVLPIPDGAPAEDLWLLHVSDGGTTQIVGGAVERGEYVAAIRSFSDVSLLHGQVTGILGIAGVPGVDLSFAEGAPEESLMRTEQAQLALGERDEPAQRVVRIVGPGELGTRDAAASAPYVAVGFEARKPRFVEYTWNLYGGDGARLSTEWRADSADVSAFRTGRYTLTVDAYDPATGATAYASKRILVVGGLVLSIDADRPGGYCCEERPIVTFDFTGGLSPVVLDWALGATASQRTFDDVVGPPYTWIAEPIREDTLVEAIVTDAAGTTSSAELLLHYEPGGPDAFLSGPSSVAVGEEAVFTAETLDFPIRDLRFIVWPAAAVVVDRRTIRVIWDEPGIGRVGVFVHSETEEGAVLPVAYDVVPVEITGEPMPVDIRVPNAPTSVSPNQEAGWRVRVQGGVVAAATGYRGYTVHVDFGDGSALQEARIPADTAAALTKAHPFVHAYEEPDEYTVTITATAPDGSSATKTLQVTVADQMVLHGEFSYEYELNEVVYQVNETEIKFVIRGTDVEITRFANDTARTYVGFTLGGGTVDPDCSFDTVYTLTDYDLTFDAETQTITGTIQGHYSRTDDVGSNCPFGGRPADEKDLDSEIFDAVIVDGTIEKGWLFGWFTASVVENPGV